MGGTSATVLCKGDCDCDGDGDDRNDDDDDASSTDCIVGLGLRFETAELNGE